MLFRLSYYSQNFTMTLLLCYYFVLVALFVTLSFIFAHGLYCHFMLGLTFLRFM